MTLWCYITWILLKHHYSCTSQPTYIWRLQCSWLAHRSVIWGGFFARNHNFEAQSNYGCNWSKIIVNFHLYCTAAVPARFVITERKANWYSVHWFCLCVFLYLTGFNCQVPTLCLVWLQTEWPLLWKTWEFNRWPNVRLVSGKRSWKV